MSGEPSGVSRRGLLASAAAATAAGALAPRTASAAAPPPRGGDAMGDADWSAFLAEQDLLWRTPPAAWDEGPFLGNGRQAAMLYVPDGSGALRMDVQHAEVQDHRPEFGVLWGLARLPIGCFTLAAAGSVTGVDWRLELWDAALAGRLTTTRGFVDLRVWVHHDRDLIVAEARPSAGEAGFAWDFTWQRAASDRIDKEQPPEGYTANPDPSREAEGGVQLCVQPMLAGGATVTAWRESTAADGARVLYCSTAHGLPSEPEGAARERALRTVRTAAARPVGAVRSGHESAWHAYYRKSFLSFPEQRLQSFYWIQLYKIASGTRRGAPVMATTGPWYEKTHWTATWWNMNAQVENMLINGSNHAELDAMTEAFRRHADQLVAQVEPAYRADSAGLRRTTDMFLDGAGTVPKPGEDTTTEAGNLLYALNDVWRSYRHTMDEDDLRDPLYPVLRRAVNYYLHFLTADGEGRLHIPPTYYPEHFMTRDCAFDLALLRWGLGTLLHCIDRLGVRDPRRAEYADALARLADQARDAETGLNIGPGIPLPGSQAGYNYLLSIFPLLDLVWDEPGDRGLIRTSLEYWWARREQWLGFSYAGAASQAALIGDGERAVEFLREQEHARYPIRPNTMYRESGPVVESPLAAGQSVHDMVCQSHGGVIRVFPAIPADWPDVAVRDFRAEGAFLLSAVLRGGEVRFVRLRSLAGEPCAVRPGIAGEVEVRRPGGGRGPAWSRRADGTLDIGLRRGEEVLVVPAGTDPELAVRPVPIAVPGARWGLPDPPSAR